MAALDVARGHLIPRLITHLIILESSLPIGRHRVCLAALARMPSPQTRTCAYTTAQCARSNDCYYRQLAATWHSNSGQHESSGCSCTILADSPSDRVFTITMARSSDGTVTDSRVSVSWDSPRNACPSTSCEQTVNTTLGHAWKDLSLYWFAGWPQEMSI